MLDQHQTQQLMRTQTQPPRLTTTVELSLRVQQYRRQRIDPQCESRLLILVKNAWLLSIFYRRIWFSNIFKFPSSEAVISNDRTQSIPPPSKRILFVLRIQGLHRLLTSRWSGEITVSIVLHFFFNFSFFLILLLVKKSF